MSMDHRRLARKGGMDLCSPKCASTTFHYYSSPKHTWFYPHSLSLNPSTVLHCSSFCSDLRFHLGLISLQHPPAPNNGSRLLPAIQFSFLYTLFLPMISGLSGLGHLYMMFFSSSKHTSELHSTSLTTFPLRYSNFFSARFMKICVPNYRLIESKNGLGWKTPLKIM